MLIKPPDEDERELLESLRDLQRAPVRVPKRRVGRTLALTLGALGTFGLAISWFRLLGGPGVLHMTLLEQVQLLFALIFGNAPGGDLTGRLIGGVATGLCIVALVALYFNPAARDDQ